MTLHSTTEGNDDCGMEEGGYEQISHVYEFQGSRGEYEMVFIQPHEGAKKGGRLIVSMSNNPLSSAPQMISSIHYKQPPLHLRRS